MTGATAPALTFELYRIGIDMKPVVVRRFGIPEMVGLGFVVGVAGGTLFGGSETFVAASAVAGAVVMPVLRISPLLGLARRVAALKGAHLVGARVSIAQ